MACRAWPGTRPRCELRTRCRQHPTGFSPTQPARYRAKKRTVSLPVRSSLWLQQDDEVGDGLAFGVGKSQTALPITPAFVEDLEHDSVHSLVESDFLCDVRILIQGTRFSGLQQDFPIEIHFALVVAAHLHRQVIPLLIVLDITNRIGNRLFGLRVDE